MRGGSRYSAIAFPTERRPSFFDEESQVRDKVHGRATALKIMTFPCFCHDFDASNRAGEIR
jgi:hypothetical protein